jgi:transcription antitermination factor NusG
MASLISKKSHGTEKAELSVSIVDHGTFENRSSWYALVTRSRQEKHVAGMLARLDIPAFLPLMTETHLWSDRKKTVTVPLFAGYVFVHFPAHNEFALRVLKTPGVVRFVGNQRGPIPIPDKEIEDVRSVLSTKVGCSPYPFLKTGDRVRIVDGAMKGLEGTLIGRGPESKLVVSIELIQRSLAISIYGFNVEPIAYARDVAA